MMQLRIYTYKITFEEIPHWYWGVHKEKKFGELYLGSPVTNKRYWDFYTPHIQILEIFDYTDEGWKKARETEISLIRSDLNNPLCLNERCGGTVSMEVARKSGEKAVKDRTGIHDPEFIASERSSEYRRKNCNKLREEKRGIFSEGYLGSEGHRDDSRKGGMNAHREKKGFFEEYQGSARHIKTAKETGVRMLEEGLGWFSPGAIAKRSQKLLVKYPDGKEVEYHSIKEAVLATGLTRKIITGLAKTGGSGKTYKSKGFRVTYLPR